MITIKHEWTIKNGFLGTAHKNRHGEWADFRLHTSGAVMIRLYDVEDNETGSEEIGGQYCDEQTKLFYRAHAPKGHCVCDVEIPCTRVVENLGEKDLDTGLQGIHFTYIFTYQGEELHYQSPDVWSKVCDQKVYDAYTAPLREKWEQESELQQLERKLIEEFLETFVPTLSPSDLGRLRFGVMDNKELSKRYISPVMEERFPTYNSWFYDSRAQKIRENILKEEEKRHEERKQVWLAKKK